MVSGPSKRLRKILRAANRAHVALYRISRGKFGNKIANLPVLLITTSGRKSGLPYTNPVVYIIDGRDYLVSASGGGMDWHPGWYLNLEHRPEAKIEIGDKTFNVQALIMGGEERKRLYEKFKAVSSNFVKYENGTRREIPVIRLVPKGT
jgi:deazaflavin-dependent oxidoreductase (nitroreductase family)